MLLNCDLGESYGSWTMGQDAQVMPYIDQANIACGFHAGDPLTLRNTLALAAQHDVSVGAHPAYPDKVGFGRRSMALSAKDIIANLHYQIAAVEGMAKSLGMTLAHVKPHGALYHDMMQKAEVRAAILEAMSSYHSPLTLMMQSTTQSSEYRNEAARAGVQVQLEVFADRAYNDDGGLLPRTQPGAVLDREQMLRQVRQLQQDSAVTTVGGKRLPLQADTLCVHGDNPQGVAAIQAIADLVHG